ncbi:efflux transporter outer membrane subunit [Sphingomonas sp. NSE70-1]|uniref:Efflux transporter outer membrane subunit n=1 Tax=Sphingomonas caseinilyticus TaxID=2908205 RepID=A0ABT0RXM2_9SPHN|nr:efflux transporter outer membrane subunit [Sphingomonas caseinilyticus]MCL6699768.1 efflux transporter outer membrane subunit [Sphingomonas caseinilyticus]
MKRSIILASLLLGACTVGPDYAEPQVAVPANYLEAPASEAATLDRWWQGFGDGELTALIDRALSGNLDIELATARIREARAMERVAGASSSPQVAAQGSVTRQRISENAFPVPPVPGGSGAGGGLVLGEEFTTWRAGFDASWELDLFGRNRREREAAAARTGSAVWSRRDAEVTVAAEVADAYVRLRAYQALKANAEAELARLQRFEQLVDARTRGGLVTGQDLEQQKSERAAAAAAIPVLEAQAKAEIHALGVLTGQSPDALAAELAPTAALPTPPVIPAGVPSDLLRRRPDIRAAERDLAASTADIGVAVADFYPRFSLTAAPAMVSTALGALLEWGSRSFSAGAALDWPIFDGGRRKANIEVQNARQEQAMIAYRRTVLTGLQDVEDSLSRIAGNRSQLAELEQAVVNATRAEDIARTRYRGGLVTFSDVLVAQSRRLSLEEQVINTKSAMARDTVALVKALGGGWSDENTENVQ